MELGGTREGVGGRREAGLPWYIMAESIFPEDKY